MVHLDKIPGQKGHMIIQEDGTLVSSSGDLASNEATSQHIVGLVSHALTANFSAGGRRRNDGADDNHDTCSTGHNEPGVNGFPLTTCVDSDTVPKNFKWNRVTVSFADQSYVACLSNRKIHVAKREHSDTNSTGTGK